MKKRRKKKERKEQNVQEDNQGKISDDGDKVEAEEVADSSGEFRVNRCCRFKRKTPKNP